MTTSPPKSNGEPPTELLSRLAASTGEGLSFAPEDNEPPTGNDDDGPQSEAEMEALLKEHDRLDLMAASLDTSNPAFGQILQFHVRPRRTALPTTATDFLREFLGADAPWPLIAIKAGDIKAMTPRATPKRDAAAAEWIKQWNDKGYEIYFAINPLKRPLNRKAKKDDVAAAGWLWIDLDPRKNEELATERQNIGRMLDISRPAGIPHPTWQIDSGRGGWGFWKLREPIPLDGADGIATNGVEAYGYSIEQAFGAEYADNCRNVERIARLPFTINHKTGRLACVVAHRHDALYDLDDFPSTEQIDGYSSEEEDSEPVTELPPMLASLLSIPDLGKAVAHGGYRTRSDLLFAFITGALRNKVAQTAIIGACLDSAHAGKAIYQHCKENGSRTYVERQIREGLKATGGVRTELMTDLGNSRRLVRLYGEDIRYVHLWESWLVWEDGHWRKDDNEAVTRLAKATVEEMHAEASRINDEGRRTEMRKFALVCQNVGKLRAMISLAESESEVILSVKEIDAEPLILGVQNGIIDLKTVTFREARRDDYVTKRAGTAYDAHAGCPAWTACLDKIFGNDTELIRYLQRACGYILTGLTSEEVMFILWGDGGRGKSTFREVIFALMGDYAIGADAGLLIGKHRPGEATPDLARLHGCRLVTVNETEENDHLKEARVKYITGHDIITARDLYEKLFDFTPTHKTMVTTQHKPIIKGTDEGIWRRLHLVAFLIAISGKEKDVNFREKMLIPELPGILNWALEGLREYHRIGLSPPKVVVDATNEYRKDMDIVGRWIEECCELDPGSRVKGSELHANYEAWAKREVGFAINANKFGRELTKRGFEKVEGVPGTSGTSRGRGYRGLRLLESSSWKREDDGEPVVVEIEELLDETYEGGTKPNGNPVEGKGAFLVKMPGGFERWIPKACVISIDGNQYTILRSFAEKEGLGPFAGSDSGPEAPRSKDDEPVVLEILALKKETAKSYLFAMPEPEGDTFIEKWIPKACVVSYDAHNHNVTVTRWFARKDGLGEFKGSASDTSDDDVPDMSGDEIPF